MSFYNRRNAAIGYLTLKAMQRAIEQKRRKRRSGMKVAAYVGLGLVSAGILAAALAIVLKRRHGDSEEIAGFESDSRDRRRVRHGAGAGPGHVSESHAGDHRSLIRPALAGLVPYEPGRPVEEVQRELGLERVVKLASNEGPYGPFPEAQEAIARAALELNRYPDGGAWRLRNALAERHGVSFEQVTVCAGADAVMGYVVPGDARSRRRDRHRVAVVPELRPRFPQARGDAGAGSASRRARRPRRMLAAITPRTKLAFIAAPNNPTGTTNRRGELDAYFARVPPHVLTVRRPGVLRVHPGSPTIPTESRSTSRRVTVFWSCGRFRRSSASRGSGSATAIGPEERDRCDRQGAPRVRRDSAGQEAALASLDGTSGDRAASCVEPARDGPARRGSARAASSPAGPAVANFLFVRVEDA